MASPENCEPLPKGSVNKLKTNKMKTYLVTFKSNNPKSSEKRICCCDANSKKEVANCGFEPYGYHMLKSSIIISSVHSDFCGFPKMPI